MKNLKTLLLSAALACSSLVVAQDLSDRGPVPFSTYDTDGNGIINKGEFNSLKEKRMNQKENQGRLLKNAYMSPAFEDVDRDKDGEISKDELKIHQEIRLQDRDRDGLEDMEQDKDQDRDSDGNGSSYSSGSSGSSGSNK